MFFFKKNQKISSYPCFCYSPSSSKKNKRSKNLFLLSIFFLISSLLFVFIDQPKNNYKEEDVPNAIVLDFIEKFAKDLEVEEIDWSLFLLAWNKVQRNFIYFDKIDKDKMNNAITKRIENFIYDLPHDKIDQEKINIEAIEAMIGELRLICPLSRLQIAPYPQRSIREIGIIIQKREETIEVIGVEIGGPAEDKIMINDELKYIDDKSIENLTLWEVTEKLWGKAGTKVKLSILRAGYADLKTFELIRREIRVLPPLPALVPPTIKWELKNDNIAYIQIFQFIGELYFDFRQVVSEILKSPAEKIILDLRNNPGSDLGIVKRVSEGFLRQDDIILIEKKRDEKREYTSQRSGDLSKKEIIVLINKGSASGAEIMAATLRDNRAAILIGEKTHGKASVQRTFHLEGKYSIIFTTNTWLTPRGKLIDIVGIIPDYEIVDADQQLNKALELLN